MTSVRRRPAAYALEGPHGRLCDEVRVADRPTQRARGLLGSGAQPRGEALMLVPCDRVHTIGMTYPITAVFTDPDLVVVAIEHLTPNQTSERHDDASVCFEMTRDLSIPLDVGDQLRLTRRGLR